MKVDVFGMLIQGLFAALIQIAVLVGAIMYASKIKSTDGILMVIGSGIGVLMQIFFRSAYRWIDRLGSSADIMQIASGIAFIGSICFAIGFLMLVMKQIKTSAPEVDEDEMRYRK